MTKKVIILVAVALMTVASVFAQDVVWKKNFGGSTQDSYSKVAVVSDGIVAVGNSQFASFGTGDWAGIEGKGGRDAIIVKHSNSGNVIWKKNFGGQSDDYYYSVAAVSDGIVAVGYSQPLSFGNGDWTGIEGKGDEDAIIVKYDNAGSIVWQQNFGGARHDHYNSITTISDGIVAVGYSERYSFGNGDWSGIPAKGSIDAIIVKYDNTGEVVWKKNLGGGTGSNYYNSVTTVSNGIIAVGYADQYTFGYGDWATVTGKGGKDAIIVKYNNNGEVVWCKNFGGSGDDYYNSVIEVSDGIVTVGYSTANSFGNGDWGGISGKGAADAIIVKYDNNGDVVWKKHFGGSGSDHYNSVSEVLDEIIVVGHSEANSFDSGDWEGVTGNGNRDAIIIKYNNDGNVVLKKNFGGNGHDQYNGVTVVSNEIIVVGFSFVTSFGNGDWTGFVGQGDDDAIIVKYGDGYLTLSPDSYSFTASGGNTTININSNQAWNVTSGAPSWLTASPTNGNNDGVFTLTATKNTTTSIRNTTVTVSGGGITRTVNITQDGVVAIGEVESDKLQIFPNPAQTEIFIKSDLQIEKVEIYSLTGASLRIENNFKEKISVSDLEKGIYFLKVYTDKGLLNSKFVKD